jgi:hypothetical protein
MIENLQEEGFFFSKDPELHHVILLRPKQEDNTMMEPIVLFAHSIKEIQFVENKCPVDLNVDNIMQTLKLSGAAEQVKQ